jgi:hypothetical protein
MRSPDWDWHCAEFAAAHVKEVTGRDIWAEVGGCPRTAKEAADLYRRLDVRTLRGAVGKVLGRSIKPALAMRGDLVLVDNGNLAPALGICRGELIECPDNMLPISRAICAWKVSPHRAKN